MYRYEVLAPAGELSAVGPLIDAGSDAIYVGLKEYSSRPLSADFSVSDIAAAAKICHEAGVRLHVAVNGCISEKKITGLYDTLKELAVPEKQY